MAYGDEGTTNKLSKSLGGASWGAAVGVLIGAALTVAATVGGYMLGSALPGMIATGGYPSTLDTFGIELNPMNWLGMLGDMSKGLLGIIGGGLAAFTVGPYALGAGAAIGGANGALSGARSGDRDDRIAERQREKIRGTQQEIAGKARAEAAEQYTAMGYQAAAAELAPYYFQKGQESVVQQIIAAKQAEQQAMAAQGAQPGFADRELNKKAEKAQAPVAGPQAV